ncbi:hypothetical protein HWV62_23967 [Athelia sp. TMB]|nr:hypothetical protein HWV62_13505 [Athelia sp. TMB]KAF7983065.1 hypothetical protein HWV62_23967 [Athelia sp. TMB]
MECCQRLPGAFIVGLEHKVEMSGILDAGPIFPTIQHKDNWMLNVTPESEVPSAANEHLFSKKAQKKPREKRMLNASIAPSKDSTSEVQTQIGQTGQQVMSCFNLVEENLGPSARDSSKSHIPSTTLQVNNEAQVADVPLATREGQELPGTPIDTAPALKKAQSKRLKKGKGKNKPDVAAAKSMPPKSVSTIFASTLAQGSGASSDDFNPSLQLNISPAPMKTAQEKILPIRNLDLEPTVGVIEDGLVSPNVRMKVAKDPAGFRTSEQMFEIYEELEPEEKFTTICRSTSRRAGPKKQKGSTAFEQTGSNPFMGSRHVGTNRHLNLQQGMWFERYPNWASVPEREKDALLQKVQDPETFWIKTLSNLTECQWSPPAPRKGDMDF